MKEIRNQRFGEERALYATKNTKIIGCRFEGEEDGESAVKECSNVELIDCYMDLRYPIWHCKNVRMVNTEMTVNCRAALWYTQKFVAENSKMNGIKALRECKDIAIYNSSALSPEFGWRSKNILIDGFTLEGEYAFFEAKNLQIKNMQFSGKYSFQYIKDMTIQDSHLKTKDAFWHSKNITVENSIIEGEYLGWYSEGLTLINCTIIGTQPLCYCKNLKLIQCKMIDCDLTFEYSEVQADLIGEVTSVKNPKSGKIIADSYGEIIYTKDSKVKCQAEVITR